MSEGISATDPAQAALGDASNEQSQLERIRSELSYYLPDLPEDEGDLRAACNEWLVAASQADDDTLSDRVSEQFNSILESNAMYVDGGKDVDECFPEDCSDCDHYGEICPVTQDRVRRKQRERIMEEADTEEDLERRLSNYAHEVGCDVLKDILSADTDYPDLVNSGQLLLRLVEERLVHTDPRDEHLRDRLKELGWL